MECTGHHTDSATNLEDSYFCRYPFEFDGQHGCCEAVPTTDPQIWFFACEP